MAQTYKFGNGTWATKKGSTLAYSDTNNAFKPLPFNFTRNSIGTRVNKEGLIEVVGNDIPRIDYTDSKEGALLLENSATNYVAYSELPSTWTYTEFGSGSDGTITIGKTDMFGGTNAVQIDFPADAENVAIRFGTTVSALTSGSASLSLYIKLVESGSKDLQLRASFSGIINVNSTEFTRVDLSGTKISAELFNLKLRPSEGTSNGGFSIIVCHPQEEQGYLTSYIPTNGSTAQRAAETCNGSGNSEVFNSQEGILFLDTKALSNDGTTRTIGLSDGSNSNRIHFINYAVANGYSVNYRVSNSTQVAFTKIGNVLDYQKIAFKYKSGDFSLWYNGFEIDTDSNTNMMADGVLNTLSFRQEPNSLPFYGNTKEIAYYDTILTDKELEYMTSYRSLNEMVTELNLNAL